MKQIKYNQVVSEYKRHQHIKLQTKIIYSHTQKVTTDNHIFCPSLASSNGCILVSSGVVGAIATINIFSHWYILVLFINRHSSRLSLETFSGSGGRLVIPEGIYVLILHPPSRAWGGREELGVREWWFPWTAPILGKWLVWHGPPSEPLYWETANPSNMNTLNWMPWIKRAFISKGQHRFNKLGSLKSTKNTCGKFSLGFNNLHSSKTTFF